MEEIVQREGEALYREVVSLCQRSSSKENWHVNVNSKDFKELLQRPRKQKNEPLHSKNGSALHAAQLLSPVAVVVGRLSGEPGRPRNR